MNTRTTHAIIALALLLIARFAVPASAEEPRLSDIVQRLRWDVAAKGALLIVSPENTTSATGKSSGTPPTQLPKRDSDGGYAWDVVGAFYARTLVDMHSLTVFAPTTMTVLNDRLPSPDPYSGMSAGIRRDCCNQHSRPCSGSDSLVPRGSARTIWRAVSGRCIYRCCRNLSRSTW